MADSGARLLAPFGREIAFEAVTFGYGNAPVLDGVTFAMKKGEVVALVGEGLSNDEIAERLIVSPATAKTHVSRAMIKLGTRDRAQLVVLAYESGLVRPGWLG